MICDKNLVAFSWDKGNIGKNKKHHVADKECEEAFFDPKKVTINDPIHSTTEARFILLGKTKQSRLLYVVYTTRNNHIRIISARDINRKEVKLYEKIA